MTINSTYTDFLHTLPLFLFHLFLFFSFYKIQIKNLSNREIVFNWTELAESSQKKFAKNFLHKYRVGVSNDWEIINYI